MKAPGICLAVLVALTSTAPARAEGEGTPGLPGTTTSEAPRKVVKSDQEWARQMTAAQFLVTRRGATEPAYSGRYVHSKARGLYVCASCDAPLFNSKAKYHSGTGWPSFWSPVAPDCLDTAPDYNRPGEVRVEVLCRRCDAHLGHVFADGPPPTGRRFCINSLSLKFIPEAQLRAAGMAP